LKGTLTGEERLRREPKISLTISFQQGSAEETGVIIFEKTVSRKGAKTQRKAFNRFLCAFA
jgi:hypothetical protein